MAVLFLTKEKFVIEFESQLSKKEIAACVPGTTFTINDDQICLLPDKNITTPKPVVVKEAKAVKQKAKPPAVVEPKKKKIPRKKKNPGEPIENQWFTGLYRN